LPPESELDQLAAFIDANPQVEIRAYGGYDGSIRDLEFLQHFRSARRVQIDALYHLESIDGLRHLNEGLESLTLGRTKMRFSMSVLARFPALTFLFLEGHVKDIEVLSALRELQVLKLRSITLPNLALLLPLTKLRSLNLKLGGTCELHPLEKMQQIEYFEAWMVRGLSDLSQVATLPRLRYLFLQTLRQVTAFPDLSGCFRLERIEAETMKGISDLHGLMTAPALRELLLIDMPQLRWKHIESLKDHPTLQRVRIGTGSKKRNAEFAERLEYPDAGGASPDLRRLRLGDLD
jgi:internalin A